MSAVARWMAPGRGLRGVLAWLAAAFAAVLAGATVTVAFLLLRESVAYAPFTTADWWVFLHLWRPLVIAGAIIAPLFSAPFTLAAVWLIRRQGWARPRADIIAGALCGLFSLLALVVAARNLGPMGDGP